MGVNWWMCGCVAASVGGGVFSHGGGLADLFIVRRRKAASEDTETSATISCHRTESVPRGSPVNEVIRYDVPR